MNEPPFNTLSWHRISAIPRIGRAKKKSRKALIHIYNFKRKLFLSEHKWCQVGLSLTPPLFIPATVVHHKRGRKGTNLIDEKTFCAVSVAGDKWIHQNEKIAIKLGLLERV